MSERQLTRRDFLRRAGIVGAGLTAMLAGCQPKIVEVTKIVTEKEVVKETVIVEKEVEKEVTKLVEKEVEKEVTKIVEKEVEKEVTKIVERVVTAVPTPIGDVNINLFARAGDIAVMKEQLTVDGFYERNPNIKIEYMGVPSEQEYLTKLLTMAAGGRMGSVFWSSIGLCNFQRFVIKDMMIDLTPLIDAEGFDIDDFYADSLVPLTFEGNKLYGLSWRVHPGVGGLIYNVELFEKEGVDPPEDGWTLDDLVIMASAMTKDTTGDGRTDQWGYVQARRDYLGYVLFIRAFDGWGISKDGKTCLFNTPEAMAGLKWFYDTFFTWKIQPPAAAIEKTIGDMFFNGKIALQQTGMWGQISAQMIEEEGKFTVRSVPFPKSPKGQRPSLFEVDCVSIGSMLREEYIPFAWELLKGTVSTEAAAYETHYCCSGGRKSGFKLAQEQKPLHPSILPYYTVLNECMEYRTCWNFRSSEYDETVKAELDPLWLGKAEPTKEFLDNVTEIVQEILDLPYPT